MYSYISIFYYNIYTCRSYILDLLEGGRKLIVFGHHKSVLASICECLKEKVNMAESK